MAVSADAAMLTPSGPTPRPFVREHHPKTRTQHDDWPRRRSGFSLIETVLVIAIVALLIALLTPSLSRFRGKARDTVNLSNLRQHAAVMTQYSADHADIMPYVTRSDVEFSILRSDGSDVVLPVRYFEASQMWFIALADGYYDGNARSPAFKPPGGTAPGALTNGYTYSCSFLALPEYWNGETRLPPPVQFRPVTAAKIAFPSRKILLRTNRGWLPAGQEDPTKRAGVALCDGSARDVTLDDVIPGFGNGEGIGFAGPYGTLGHGGIEQFGSHTRGGAAGFDLN